MKDFDEFSDVTASTLWRFCSSHRGKRHKAVEMAHHDIIASFGHRSSVTA